MNSLPRKISLTSDQANQLLSILENEEDAADSKEEEKEIKVLLRKVRWALQLPCPITPTWKGWRGRKTNE